jgi:MoaA/NifB/PqqE/SkfB family radical SAM enzyme
MKSKKKYGFQAHLNSEFPSQIIVDVTEFCTLACIHCPHEEFTKSKEFGGRNLNIDIHKKLIDEIANDGKGYCKYLRYTAQGEPLLNPKIMEMLAYAGKYAATIINLTTNGTMLTPEKSIGLLDAGVNVFDISIDAYAPETYSKIRIKGDLNTTKGNVLKLIELIKKGGYRSKVVVSFVEQQLNKQESGEFERFWNEAGVDYVVIRRLHSSAGFKKEFVHINEERYPCLYPWERLTLDPDGNIHFCPQDWKRGSIVCEFKESTIKEIWRGDYMQKLREAHLNNDYSQYPFCGQCPDWSTTRWPNDGRSYSNMMKELIPMDLLDADE